MMILSIQFLSDSSAYQSEPAFDGFINCLLPFLLLCLLEHTKSAVS